MIPANSSNGIWSKFEALVPTQELHRAPVVATTQDPVESFIPSLPAAPEAPLPVQAAPTPPSPPTPSLEESILADQQAAFQARQAAIAQTEQTYSSLSPGSDFSPASATGGIMQGWNVAS